MKSKHSLLSLFCLALTLSAQTGVPTSVQFGTSAPPPIAGTSANWTGPVQPGSGTSIFYWVVVRYPIGMTGPFGPIAAGTVATIRAQTSFIIVLIQDP